MSAGKIRIVLDLDDNGFHARMEKAGKVTRDFTKELKSNARSIKNIEKGVTGLLPRLRDYAITASILKGGLSNLARATLGWQKTMIDNIGNVERMTFLLKGMSSAATDAGRAMEATNSLDYLLDKAEKAPFSLNEMTNSFVKFKSVGLDPMDGSLSSLTDAVASFGGNDQILHRASVAIQQMAGKGVISMEELRQQLGEAVPNAIKLMARSMGMTYGELVDNISKGRVKARGALDRMFGEFERTMGGSSERMMETWSGMLAKLQTRWLKFQLAIGESGYFDEAKLALQGVLDAMTPEKVAEIAATIGKALTGMIKAISWTIKTLYDLRNVIAFTVKALGTLFIVTRLATKIAALGGAIKVIGLASIAAGPGLMSLAGGATASSLAMTGMAAASGVLKGAMLALGGPLGLIVLALGAAYAAWDTWGNSAGKASEKVKNALASIDEDDVETLESHAKVMQARMEFHMKNLERATKAQGKSIYSGFFWNADTAEKVLVNYQKEFDLALANTISAQQDHDAAIASITNTNGRKAVTALEKQLSKEVAVFRAHYVEVANEAHDAFEAGDMQREAFQAAQNSAMIDYYDGQINIIKGKSALFSTQMAAATKIKGEEQQVAILEKQIDFLAEKLLDLNKSKDIALKQVADGADLGQGTMGAGVRNMEKYIEKLTTKLMGLGSTLNGTSSEVQQFQFLLDQGAFGAKGVKHTQDQIDMVKALLVNMELMNAKIKENKQVVSINTAISKSFSKIAHEVGVVTTKLYDGDGPKTTFADGATKSIKAMIDLLPEGSAAIAGLREQMANLTRAAAPVDTMRAIIGIKDEALDADRSLMTERTKNAFEYLDKITEINRLLVLSDQLSNEDRIKATADLNGALKSINEQYVISQQTDMQKLNEEWQDMGAQMQGAMTGWASQSADAIVEFVRTGKLAFSDLVGSIMADILKMAIQQQITGPLFSMLSGAMSGPAFTTDYGIPMTGSDGSIPFANGGIMSPGGKVPLKAYSTGGIANSPQLSLFGEGRTPEAYVPLPDGKTIPVSMAGGGSGDVQVNVINQTSQSVNAEKSAPTFDGKRMVLDVVLTEMAKPGAFRDGMKSVIK
tara:strand:- start:28329 stop:31595 length:3267 start_codon:yes stop_codon:yes gene_type:complete